MSNNIEQRFQGTIAAGDVYLNSLGLSVSDAITALVTEDFEIIDTISTDVSTEISTVLSAVSDINIASSVDLSPITTQLSTVQLLMAKANTVALDSDTAKDSTVAKTVAMNIIYNNLSTQISTLASTQLDQYNTISLTISTIQGG